ncbi:MAG: toprim domain-containing protein, partial [Gemmobacter sp.]
FPIRDARGRAISLAGRALDPQARAKYLNGPETPIFDKGRTVFNLGPAREAAGRGAQVILAEGYMDVIALVEAGFDGAVAPMGTAVTAEQLGLIWAAHDEPVVALDGDAAGMRAAMRLVDLALPLVEAGRGLRFVTLPGGQDPDDLIRAGGPAAFATLLAGAQPLVALLWRRETEGQVFDSPERRAGLDKRLRAAIGAIRDAGLRDHYAAELRRLRAALFLPQAVPQPPRGPARSGRGRFAAAPPATPLPSMQRSALAADMGTTATETLREAVILVTLARHPALLPQFESALDRLDLAHPDHAAVRDALVTCAWADDPAAAWADARPRVAEALDRMSRHPHVRTAPCVRSTAAEALAARCVEDDLERLAAGRAAYAEVEYAETEITGMADEGITWRLARAAEARNRAARTPLEDVPPEGAAGADDSLVDRLLAGQAWLKHPR